MLLVNGVRWQQVPTPVRANPDAHGSGTPRTRTVRRARVRRRRPRRAAADRARQRARDLPHGTGLAGRVGAGALTTALDRPPGLLAVSEPARREGGADPETIGTRAPERAADRPHVRPRRLAAGLRGSRHRLRRGGEGAGDLDWAGSAGRSTSPSPAQAAAASRGGPARLAASLDAARDPNHPLRLANHVPVERRRARDRWASSPTGDRATSRRRRARSCSRRSRSTRSSSAGRSGSSDVFRMLQAVPGVALGRRRRARLRRPGRAGGARRLEPGPCSRACASSPPVPTGPRPAACCPGELLRIATAAADVTLTPKGGLAG